MLFGNMTVFHAFLLYSEELYKNAEQELILSEKYTELIFLRIKSCVLSMIIILRSTKSML